jgi:hypothetical protein
MPHEPSARHIPSGPHAPPTFTQRKAPSSLRTQQPERQRLSEQHAWPGSPHGSHLSRGVPAPTVQLVPEAAQVAAGPQQTSPTPPQRQLPALQNVFSGAMQNSPSATHLPSTQQPPFSQEVPEQHGPSGVPQRTHLPPGALLYAHS